MKPESVFEWLMSEAEEQTEAARRCNTETEKAYKAKCAYALALAAEIIMIVYGI